MENHENKTSLRKTRFWIRESVMRTEGVNTYSDRPRAVPLIKNTKLM